MKMTRRFAMKSAGVAGAALTFGGSRAWAHTVTPDASPVASPSTETVVVSSVEGVPNAYTAYPKPFKAVDGVPGNGGSVKMATLSYSPPPVEHDKNDYWKGLEERLGVTWDATIIPIEAYNERLSTIFASGDIPDLTYLLPGTSRPGIYDALKEGAFKDLTPIVESDEIKKYPNLAAYPKYMWDATRYEGKIWGVPKPVLRNNDVAYYRSDWAKKLGIELTDAQSVHDYLVGVSTKDPDGNGDKGDTYGLAPYDGAWDSFLLSQIFKVPYNWRLNDDGTLTNEIETDEYRAMLEFLVQLYKDGAYHPDAAGMDVTAAVELMTTGRTAMASNGFIVLFGSTGYRGVVKEAMPEAELTPLVMPGVDGGKGCTYQTSGIYGYTAISATSDDERTAELLRIMNYLASPFGSEEMTYVFYGTPGKTSEEQPAGGYKLTEEGKAQKSALVYPFVSENFFYYSGAPEEALIAQKHNEEMAKNAIADPTMGLFSATQAEKGSVIGQYVGDMFNNIVTGREPIDKLDEMIAEWKKRGGDEIRAELEEAIKNRG